MFTFKKIALLGIASLVAFTMSCSDDEGSDPSGSFSGLTITDSPNGIKLAGTITGTGDVTVLTVAATADGHPVEVKDYLPGPSVNLTGAYLSGVCAISGSKEYSIVITATLSDNTTINSDTKKVAVNCGTVPSPGTSGTYTLSGATGSPSYLDVDGKKTYTQVQLTDSIKATIDLIAYWSADAGDNVYSGYGNVTTIGGVSLARIFKTKDALDAAAEEDLGEPLIPITTGTVFYLESDELDKFEVTVTAFTAGESVTLKVEAL
ncbi:hypothetical protein R83H12_01002 [Fibrobacteria bacterium R8-3-H12]